LLFEPRSRGLPKGFLDQPFYGWVDDGFESKARFGGLAHSAWAVLVLKPFDISMLKRAKRIRGGATRRYKRRSSNPSGKPRERG
jgi:hypothetical protein